MFMGIKQKTAFWNTAILSLQCFTSIVWDGDLSKRLSEAVEKGEKQKPLKTREGITNSYKSTSSKKTIFFIRLYRRGAQRRRAKRNRRKIRQNSELKFEEKIGYSIMKTSSNGLTKLCQLKNKK